MFGNIFGGGDDSDNDQDNDKREKQQQPQSPPPAHQDIQFDQQKPTHNNEIGNDKFDPENVTINDYEPTFDPNATEGQMGKEVLIMNDKHNQAYAGSWPREMFENAYQKPTQATWIGYKSNPQEGLREIPIEHNAWFRHCGVFGTTGYGKTTFLKNIMIQWAYAGYGFCFIDPKGDGVMDLMEEIPTHRLDDVIWIDPAPEESDKVVGVNFLQPGIEGTPEELAAEKESIIDDLENIIKNESYWGPRMGSVFSTIARGMIESEKNYTLIDMYQVLVDESYREMFVDDVDDPLVKQYTRVIAEEMDQSDLDALVRRLKRLVNNNITREIISHKESSFRIRDAVENGKIIMIKNDQDNADAKQMIATGMMRRIWAAIKARKEVPEEERTPYFLIVDEFDDVVTDNADVDKMLSKARSFRLSVTLCNQQPSQLPQDIQQAIMGNCDNLLSFNPNNPADARLIMKKFGNYGAKDLLSLGRFKLFSRISVNNEQSPPFITQTYADYPPMRTRSEAREAINKSLEQYGTDRLDPKQIAKSVVLDMDSNEAGAEQGIEPGAAQQLADDHAAKMRKEDGSVSITEQDILESLYALELKRDSVGEFLAVDDVKDELMHRLNEDAYDSVPAEAVEQLQESANVNMERQDGELRIQLTQDGREQVVDISSGSVATGGGNDHRYILKRSFETFTMAGFKVTIPEQEGKEQPDGIGEVPMNMSATSPQEMQAKMQKFKEKYPIASSITDGTALNIEAETSTINKPKQTLTNLRKAIEEERKCVFTVKDMESEKGDMAFHAKKGARILLAPPLVKNQDRHGNRKFYNKSSRLEVEDGIYAVRSQDTGHHTEWWENAQDGSIELRDRKSGTVISKFNDRKKVLDPTKNDVPAYYRYDQSKNAFLVYVNKSGERDRRVYTDKEHFKEEWAPIRPPFIPEEEFPRQPRKDDWMFVIFPDDDKDIPPQRFNPELTTDGKITGTVEPLLPAEHLPDTSPPETENDTESTTTTEDESGAPAANSTSNTVEVESEPEENSTSQKEQATLSDTPDPEPEHDAEEVNVVDYQVVHDEFNGIYHVVDDTNEDGGIGALCGDHVIGVSEDDCERTDDLSGYDLCIACEADIDNE